MSELIVAGYCRVSTDQYDQIHSFVSQKRYFRDYIERKSGWKLAEIYADEGISGTSIKNRDAFLQMMKDASAGKFRLLLTKEVSRFSRNILDTIACTRQLKSYGVGVIFITDGIDTRDPDAELRLSIMASIAQEESRKTSCRVKWGQTRRMEQGIVFGHSLLGYDVKGGVIRPDPYGAEIVRLIFQKYAIEKKSASLIARELEADGWTTASGTGNWNPGNILRILRNEKYVGDLIQKKSFTPDYLTHKKKTNQGEEPYVVLNDHHAALVSRELWKLAQEELKRRGRKKHTSGCGTTYLLSGKIWCGVCGNVFHSRIRKRRDGSEYRKWGCNHSSLLKNQAYCTNSEVCRIGVMLRDETALLMVQNALKILSQNGVWLRELTESTINECFALAERPLICTETIQKEIHKATEKKNRLLNAYISGDITHNEFTSLKLSHDNEIRQLQEKIQKMNHMNEFKDEKRIIMKRTICDLFRNASKYESFLHEILGSITVHPDRTAILRFNGQNAVWKIDFKQSAPTLLAIYSDV